MSDFNGYAGYTESSKDRKEQTSFGLFEVLAADESDSRLSSRKALLLSEQRVSQQLGKWLETTSPTEFDAKIAYVSADFDKIISAACEEVGHGDPTAIATSLRAHFRPVEAKKPLPDFLQKKQDEESESDGENDDEEKDASISEAALIMASNISNVTPFVEEHGDEQIPDRVSALPKASDYNPGEQKDDSGKKVPCPRCGGSGKTASHTECSRCEGSGKVSDWGPSALDALESKVAGDGPTGLGGPEPKMDKAKWTPQNVKELDVPSKYNPTERKDILEPLIPDNEEPLKEIGEDTTIKVDLPSGTSETGFSDGGVTKGDSTQTFPKGKHIVDPVTSKTADAVSYPPNAEQLPEQPQGFQQTPTSVPYNPAANEGLVDTLHPAAKYTYEYAVQQGASPQDAMTQAQAKQSEMQERSMQGQNNDGVQIPVLGHAEENPLLELVKSDFDGFVPQSVVSRRVAALRQ